MTSKISTESTSCLDVSITNVLPDIGKFLDVASTVKLSQTCRTIHGLLTHDSGGRYPKIKVPYFTMGDSSMCRETTIEVPDPSADADAPQPRICLAPRILPTIHFPSLKRFVFRFEAGKVFANKDDELKDSFVYLASFLELATNLEELHIDVGLFMRFDNFNSRMIYELFSKNLVKCKKLKGIKIFNHFAAPRGKSYYSIGFLMALIPTIQARVLTLEEVTLLMGNEPVVKPTRKAYINATHDLFVAVLSLQGLQDFNFQVNLLSSSLLNVFLEAANQVRRTYGSIPSSRTIEKFLVTCVLYKTADGKPAPLPKQLSLAPCIALLGNARNLYSFAVRVPPVCWDSNSVAALKDLLSNKPKLRHLGLYFHGYECTSGNCLEYILDYIQERENCPDNVIHVSGLSCHNTRFDEEEALERYYSRDGEKCLSSDETGLKFQAKGFMIGW